VDSLLESLEKNWEETEKTWIEVTNEKSEEE
jgi:hypothetical protein